MPRYDWHYYRNRYVSSDDSLEHLSRLPNSPALNTLKKRSAREGWAEQRQQYRHQIGTKAKDLASTEEAEVAARHIRISRSLQGKALQALQGLEPSALKPNDLLNFLREAVKIERDALGLENEQTLRIVAKYRSVNLSELSDEELDELHRRVQDGAG